MTGTEEQSGGATDRSGCHQLACAFFVAEFAGNVFGAFARPVVTVIDRFADGTGDDATSKSANQSDRGLDDPLNRFCFVIQRKRGSYCATQH